MDDILAYLKQLGREEKQCQIFLHTYQYGPKPASTIASLCKCERSYAYKVLQHFVRLWVIASTNQAWATHFFVPNVEVLQSLLDSKEKELDNLKNKLPSIQKSLSLLDNQKIPYIPKSTTFEWVDGIKQRAMHMQKDIQKQGVLQISCIVTSTFESQVNKILELQSLIDKFIDYLEENKISLTIKLGSGQLVVEQFFTQSLEEAKRVLQVGNQAVQLWIIWEVCYLGLFREFPVGMRISSPDFSDLMHVIVEHLR